MADYVLKRNDTGPDLQAILSNASGVENLAGCSVKCIWREKPGGTAKVNASATIVDAGAGSVKYTPTASDTDTAGEFFVEWEVTTGGGTVKTFPNDSHQTLSIAEDLA